MSDLDAYLEWSQWSLNKGIKVNLDTCSLLMFLVLVVAIGEEAARNRAWYLLATEAIWFPS